MLGYLGPNGAGKTTTIRLLLGLIRATAGTRRDLRHRLPGRPGRGAPPGRLRARRGQPVAVAHRNGDAAPAGRVQGRVDAAYRDQLIERFEFDPSKKVRAYSKGNRQKLILIAGLMTRADLLLLDEPTSGLDPLMELAFRECVDEARDRGQTVFLSSHILSEVEALCDRVAILRAGRLVEMGTLAEMRHLSALQVEAEFDGTVPDLSTRPRRERRAGRRPPGPVPGDRLDGAAARRAGRRGRPAPDQPGAVARGAVPRPLRRDGADGSTDARVGTIYDDRRASTGGRPSRPPQRRGPARARCGATCSAPRSRRPRTSTRTTFPTRGLAGPAGALGAGERRVRGAVRDDPPDRHRGRLHGVQVADVH